MPQRIPPEMALAIARRESEFYPKVESPVGALGMMQVCQRQREKSQKGLVCDIHLNECYQIGIIMLGLE